MKKPILCDGNCGKLLDFELESKKIYLANGKYYCEKCAAKLPKYIMKKCSQCRYFGIEKDEKTYCDLDFLRYIHPHDDACKHYEPKGFINI